MDLSSHTETENSFYHVERLHKVPALMNECCVLINMEWKRSHTARMKSIEGSCEDFPMSLILLKNNEKPEVVGHCKISKLSLLHTKVFVETVVIRSNLRGKGLGTFLMIEVEKVCRSKNVKWIYLVTQGQEKFYEKLGYIKCAPVNIYGCHLNDSAEDINNTEGNQRVDLNSSCNKSMSTIIPCPPPLPPEQLFSKTIPSAVYPKKTYMRKKLI